MSDTRGNYLSQEALPTNSASTGKKGTTENFKCDGSDRHKAVKDGMSKGNQEMSNIKCLLQLKSIKTV